MKSRNGSPLQHILGSKIKILCSERPGTFPGRIFPTVFYFKCHSHGSYTFILVFILITINNTGDSKCGFWKHTQYCIRVQFTHHNSSPHRWVYAAEQENSWCTGTEGKGEDRTKIMGRIPRNYSYFRWWQSHQPSNPTCSLFSALLCNCGINLHLVCTFGSCMCFSIREPLISLQIRSRATLIS